MSSPNQKNKSPRGRPSGRVQQRFLYPWLTEGAKNRYFVYRSTVTLVLFDERGLAHWADTHKRVPDGQQLRDLLGHSLIVVNGKLARQIDQGKMEIGPLMYVLQHCKERSLVHLLKQLQGVLKNESAKREIKAEVQDLPKQHPLHAENLALKQALDEAYGELAGVTDELIQLKERLRCVFES